MLKRGVLFFSCCSLTASLQFDATSEDSIRSAASTVASNLVKAYQGPSDGTGLLPQPHYWWEAGAMWNGMLDYFYVSGDGRFNSLATQALLAQMGPNQDYMPPNQTKSEGNDDQAVWALAALSASDYGIRLPNSDSGISNWTDLAINVWNDQNQRWDSSTCNGGLRWQIFTFNAGYDYKNSPSNSAFFQLSARLAALTGNSTYSDTANKVWDWLDAVGLVSENGARVFDGTFVKNNCSDVNHIQWTMAAGVMLRGASEMWNVTKDDQWRNRTTNLLQGSQVFFTNSTTGGQQVIYEPACEPNHRCTVDQQAFRYYLANAMASTAVAHSELKDTIAPLLAGSATGAAASCSDNGTCSEDWSKGTPNRLSGASDVGQDLSALGVISGHGMVMGMMGGRKAGSNSTGSNPTSTQSGGESSSTSGSGNAGSGMGALLNGGMLTAILAVVAAALL
ncbi:MAG: hypothetical protein Q9227_002196 [Pyrenula ochraceoflavens]